MKVDPLSLSCAILAATRKHMNLEVVWNQEISQLTTLKLSDFREVFEFLDRRYSKSFPESVQNQERQVNGRQRLEPMRQVQVPEQHLQSVENTSAKYLGSATTQPNTHHGHSAASYSTKYGTISSAECYKSSSAKTIEETTEIKRAKAISVSNIESEDFRSNI